MNKIARIARLLVLLWCSNLTFSQSLDEHFVVPDSLKPFSYEEVLKKFWGSYEDTAKAIPYLKTCLAKAVQANDSLKMAEIYARVYFYEENDSLKLEFLNKSISLSKNLVHTLYPAFPYSSKGNFYLEKWDYENALDNYLKALDYAKKSKNESFQYMVEYNIGLIKSELGKHQEALQIFRKSREYEEKRGIRDTIDYLDIMVHLTESYTKNNKIDSSDYYIARTFSSLNYYDENLYYQLLLNQGVNFYCKKEYLNAEKTLIVTLPYLKKIEDKAFLVKAYYYLGKIKESLVDHEESIFFYKRIDSVFNYTQFIVPEVREGYLFLINNYKAEQDFENQLFYVDRLLKFDSIMRKNNTQVNEKLVKQYDTAKLLAEKEKLIEVVYTKNSNFKLYIWILVGIVFGVTILFYYQFQKRKLYAQRFNALMKEQNRRREKMAKESVINAKTEEIKKLKIAEEIKTDILAKIEKFEANKEFLEPNITTNSLATQFKTNSKYVSRIVNIYKEKNFTNYINDLRVEYLIEELKTNKKFRNYTIKAISSEIGFNTTEAFSKYFHKKTGLYPSYFIKRITEYEDELEVPA
ncbi:AraC family transcriptional regulator [Aquimarina spongiae]|uniref:Two-component response regulator, YesN/AraC family, consists of REC and AraC-type DNA-binding domains n=1 Tax=Aquimarina spongiae TaxID=570521 RepID=A0A1M6D5G2_9FLAO|nr:AraC family transcriptional regulator [Aquimarina spongiae]SHI68371.1 Two-component response regulator, YesN/AraC family, consists of REC and AraC-type DNA-binding domains [Aquimarina spongiae]